MEILKFLGLLAFTWLFVEGSQPVQFIKKVCKLHADNPPKQMWAQVIMKLVNCCLCSGFWFGLIYYQDILMACVVSIAAELFARILNYLFNNVLNKI